MKINEDLREQVKQQRKERGWTQNDMAAKAGLSLRTYQSFEAGQSWPQRANLLTILDVLGLAENGSAGDDSQRWSGDVQVFLDVIGTFMERLSDGERRRFIRDETRRIFAQMPHSATWLDPTEEDEARAAMRAELDRPRPGRDSETGNPANGAARRRKASG